MAGPGRYRLRWASGFEDLAAARGLRGIAFRGGAADDDPFDAHCLHVLIEDPATGQLVCCYRLLLLDSGAAIGRSYAASVYDLSRLALFAGPMLELGRFCLHPDHHHPDILRLAWAALTAFVDRHRVGLLFGCSSFAGTDPAPYAQALALLGTRHPAPERWRPGQRAAETLTLPGGPVDLRAAGAQMPPLLRTYLGMGGWVSDHAVIDRAMNTLHVFTGVEIAAVPEARQRLLRELATSLDMGPVPALPAMHFRD